MTAHSREQDPTDAPVGIPGLTVLRAIAVVLITNSHLETLYPLPILGTGGALGNALFFALSGYGLAISRSRQLPFGRWMLRRAARIYPSVTIVSLLLLAFLGIPEIRGVWDVVVTFVYPTRWWFLGALLAFYIPAYWVIRTGTWRAPAIAAALAIVPYALIYVLWLDTSVWSIEGPASGALKYAFYWQTMMLGIAMGLSRQHRGTAGRRSVIAVWSVLAAYFGFKGLLYLGMSYKAQFLLHIMTLVFLYLSVHIAEHSPGMGRFMSGRAGAPVALLAAITLEVYIVQYQIRTLPLVESLSFPLNIVVFAVGTVAVAWIVHVLGRWVRGLLGGWVSARRGRAEQGRS